LKIKRKKFICHYFGKEIVSLKNEKPGKLDPLLLGPYEVLEVDRKGSNGLLNYPKRKGKRSI
jgi:hypothetical protein